MPLDLQTKLLRVLQDRTFQPLGSPETRTADVRIIAATNRDLQRAVELGEFREDLFYRLNVVTITLPPLRKRKEDIPALAEFFVRKYAAQYRREPPQLSEELIRRLMEYRWPGNVRELENVIHRAVVMARGPVLTLDDVPLLQPEPPTERHESVERWLRHLVRRHIEEDRRGSLHEEVLQEVEIPLFQLVLEETGGNKSRAAEILGINRNTLHAKMKRYRMLDETED
ncbi:MAG: hypothetical protein KatS3mg115_0459 [Candidatus Poribacteria bacterium]|nr:MAG: hypothetical protein KatS3mg115_0459 [Candidatus Poribacteria bacterium]